MSVCPLSGCAERVFIALRPILLSNTRARKEEQIVFTTFSYSAAVLVAKLTGSFSTQVIGNKLLVDILWGLGNNIQMGADGKEVPHRENPSTSNTATATLVLPPPNLMKNNDAILRTIQYGMRRLNRENQGALRPDTVSPQNVDTN